MTSVQVAAYGYDSSGRLVRFTDPRSGLVTEYGYDAMARLTAVKPPGQQAFRFIYSDADDKPKLVKVERDRPAGDAIGGTATLATFVYDVPLTGPGLPDVSATAVGAWNQRTVAERGFAVFGPERPLAGPPTEPDWQFADLQYTDASGATVNEAAYGAGDWQLSARDFNEQGNVVRSLDERALRLFRTGQVASADQVAELTVYNEEIRNAAGEVVTPAGMLVVDTFGPARMASVGAGPVRWLRPRVHRKYDEHAPNNGIDPATSAPYWQLTSETTSAHDPGTGQDVVLARRLTDYGDQAGWSAGLVARSAIDVDQNSQISTGDLVATRQFDAEERLIETRQPGSDGTDAGTTKYVYYTGTARTDHPECGGKPYWAGLHCKTYPASTPSSSIGATPTLPTTTSSAFNYLLDPAEVTETSGSVTRTTTRTYTAGGDPQSTQTQVAVLTGSTPVSTKTTSYNSATGLAEDVTATSADGTITTIRTRYDTWGRQISYQSGTDTPATTSYDAAGRIAAKTDANGGTTYSYDGADALGRVERRGLPTKVEVTSAGSTWTSTAAYDGAEALVVQKLPGGITQQADLDVAGRRIGLSYTGQVVVDGQTQPDGPWLSWSRDYDLGGRVTREWTPEGAAFTGPAGDGPGDATPYDRSYAYDAAGRLAEVRDRTAATTGVDVTDPAKQPGCVTRRYTFDANDNRLGRSTSGPGPDGACSEAGTEQIRLYDTADRIVRAANGTSLYTYDALGRNTVLPAADAPHPERGDIRLGYYDNDLVRSISQGGVTTTYGLDAANRRSVDTVETSTGRTETVRHYSDSSDNPTWIETGAATERFASLLGGDLDLSISQDGSAKLRILNPHGDAVSTVPLAGSSTVGTGLTDWQQYDEYGNTSGTSRYGWIGGYQRESGDAGLSLMGVRVYNPVTGAFTSVDPVIGGGANRYAYPTDPMNLSDLTGKWWAWYYTTLRNWGLFEFYTWYFALIYGIPFPQTNWNPNAIYNVYIIRYLSKGRWYVWKYGITTVGSKRYKDQIPTCRRRTGSQCVGKWLVKGVRGWRKARVWESYFITVYAINHGGYRDCPPGQEWPSCR
ncbi:RHS repeat-associated core domain-containing protein [Kribbella sp. NPDC023972]|uniref:RHS repeat-associated core domain-containing protein n=1 Tax=Kribbella sp. NPDC023972 TaxID=3154795 RepID=UPI0033D1B94A